MTKVTVCATFLPCVYSSRCKCEKWLVNTSKVRSTIDLSITGLTHINLYNSIQNYIMKKFLIFTALILSSISLFGQNKYIQGPQELFICEQGCFDYFFEVPDPDIDYYDWNWYLNDPNFGNINYFNPEDSSQIVLCIDGNFFQTLILFADVWYDDAAGNTTLLHDSIFLYIIQDIEPLTIFRQTCDGTVMSTDTLACFDECEFTSQTYTVEDPSGGTTDGRWTVQGAESFVAIGNQVDVEWGNAGTGYISYESFNSQCQTEVTACININQRPLVDFIAESYGNADTITVCKNQIIYFENLTTGADHYAWTFGDGETSEEFHPNHAFDTEGFYTVELSAYRTCPDCEASSEMVVEVLPAAAPELSCLATVCPDVRQKYTALTDGCNIFNWSISGNGRLLAGGDTDDDFIDVVWESGPEGIIELSVSDCNSAYCSSIARFKVPVISLDGPVNGDTEVCANELTSYSAPSFPGATYTWSLNGLGTIVSGQGTNAISVQWGNASAIQTGQIISVTYDHCYHDCGGTDDISVSITPNLFASGDRNICMDSDGSFSATAGFLNTVPVPVNWSIENNLGAIVFNSTSPSADLTHTMSYPPGEYTILARVVDPTQFCESEYSLTFNILELPAVPLGIIGDTVICPGTEYGYTVESAGEYNTTWEVVDGANIVTYDGNVCRHTFGSTPPYAVRAYHVDIVYPSCLSDAFSIDLKTGGSQTIFGDDDVCLEEVESYFVDAVGGATYTWAISPSEMGNITDNGLEEVEIFWTQSGNATLTLDICGESISYPILIRPLPQYTVDHPTGLCENDIATISTTPTFDSYTWLSEEHNVIGLNPTLDATYGFYGVEATDQFGCTEKKSFAIEAYPSPVARISTPDDLGVCDFDVPVSLHAATDGIDYSFQWFKDGVAVGTDQPIYDATDYGRYYVEVTNGVNCSSRSLSLRVFDFCDTAGIGICDSFTCAPKCAVYGGLMTSLASSGPCNEFDFELLNTNVDPTTITWELENEFGYYERIDGNPITRSYNEPGYYTVGVRARVDGYVYPEPVCYHYQYEKILVPLTADFIADKICAGENVDFFNKSTFFPGEGIASTEWNFDDPSSGANNTSTDFDASHVFSTSGEFNVTLRVTSLSGCVSEKVKTVYAAAPPRPEITSLVDACEDQPVQFSVVDTLYDYIWDFGDASAPVDNNDAVVANVRHTFENTGSYTVMVTAANVYGCIGSEQTSIEIHPNTLNGSIDADPSLNICQGDSALLTANINDVDSYLWNTEEITDRITVKESGHYSVQVKDDKGCEYIPDPVFLQVVPKPEITLRARVITGSGTYGDWTDNLEVCSGTEIEIGALGGGDLSYLWSNSEDVMIIDFTIEGSDLLAPGSHTFSVVATDNLSNCVSDVKTITVIIRDLPNTPVVAMTSGSGCAFSSNVLEVTNPQNNVTYTWSDGQVGTTITVTEEGVYTVEAMNEFGCTSSSITSASILNTPDINLFPSGCFIDCNPAEICIPPIANVDNYTIYFDNAVLVSGTGSPANFTATQSGDYHIEMEGLNGCASASDILSLELYPGLGEIITTVYEDVNKNGIVDAGDTTLTNIPVWVTDDLSTMFDKAFTDENGVVSFPQMPQLTYTVHFGDMLSPVFNKVIDSVAATIVSCDQVINVNLLVDRNCSVDGDPQNHIICIGDSVVVGDTTFHDFGIHTAVLEASDGCDSLIEVTINEETIGSVVITVYLDKNADGLIDAGDSLLSGIPVRLIDGAIELDDVTDLNGQALIAAETETWTASIDTASISGYRYPYYQEVSFLLEACDTVEIDFLLAPNCPLSMTEDFIQLCPGDSTMIAGAYYSAGVHVVAIPNGLCDSVVTYTIVDSLGFSYAVEATPACTGMLNGSIVVDANDNASIIWAHNGSTDFILEGLSPDVYEFTLTQGGCSVTEEVLIESVDEPMPVFDSAGPDCPGESNGRIILTNYLDGDFWTVNGEVQQTAVKGGLAAGEYLVVVGEGPCAAETTIVLEEPDVLPIDLDQNMSVPINTSADILHNYMDSVDLQYIWEPQHLLTCDDCSNPTFLGSDDDVLLSVTVITSGGCVLTDSTVIQIDSTSIVFVPTAFSPDDNNINDRFVAYPNDQIVAIKKLQIFDRWGERLYEEERIEGEDFKGWDGNYADEPLPSDQYMYLVDIVFKNGKEEIRQGDFYLIR